MLVTLGCQRVNILSTSIFFIGTPAVSCSLRYFLCGQECKNLKAFFDIDRLFSVKIVNQGKKIMGCCGVKKTKLNRKKSFKPRP